jgi:uncharacterized protein (TIGR02231 family)
MNLRRVCFSFLAIAGLALLAGIAVSNDGKNLAAAAPVPKIAVSRIVHATVYPNSALITREVETPPGTGIFELVVSPLPAQTIDSSLYSEGTDGIRILSTRYRQRPIREDTREEVRKLEDDLKKLTQNGQRLQADLLAAQQNMQMVGKIEDFTSTTSKVGDKSPVNSESIIALSKYVMECRAAKAKEVVALQQQIGENTEQINFLRRQLQDLAAGTTRIERDAVIVIDKVNAEPGKVRLNYLVSSAAWRPQYKFRASRSNKGPVQVEYLAAVTQQSGEDWTGIAITLSTAQPMLNATPPDLAVLNVTVVPKGTPMAPGQIAGNPNKDQIFGQAQMSRSQAVQEYLRRDSGNAAKLLHLSREELLALKNAGATLGMSASEGPSVTCHLASKYSVPSRTDEQVIEVAKLQLDPEYFWKAVPALTAHVYRQANLTNKSQHVLLPGEATMYHGTDFVGRMNLPLVAVGEQFTVGFGVDPQLQVSRSLVDKSRTTQGGNQVLRYEYRILVSSYKPEPVALQLWDRLPHAENETIGITLQKVNPDLSKDSLYQRECRPHNLLRWDLKIDPTMNGDKAFTVNYEFQMALDKNMSIADFKTREPLPTKR